MWNYSITRPALKILLYAEILSANYTSSPKSICCQNIPMTPKMITRFLLLIYWYVSSIPLLMEAELILIHVQHLLIWHQNWIHKKHKLS